MPEYEPQGNVFLLRKSVENKKVPSNTRYLYHASKFSGQRKYFVIDRVGNVVDFVDTVNQAKANAKSRKQHLKFYNKGKILSEDEFRNKFKNEKRHDMIEHTSQKKSKLRKVS